MVLKFHGDTQGLYPGGGIFRKVDFAIVDAGRSKAVYDDLFPVETNISSPPYPTIMS